VTQLPSRKKKYYTSALKVLLIILRTLIPVELVDSSTGVNKSSIKVKLIIIINVNSSINIITNKTRTVLVVVIIVLIVVL